MKNLIFIFAILAMMSLVGCAQSQTNSRGEPLPKLLIIGDSISIGYTPVVKEMLAGEFQVQRIHDQDPGDLNNAKNSWFTLSQIEYYLSQCPDCSTIVWNNGIWNTFRAEIDKGNCGHTTEDEYEAEITLIAKRLKQTGARVLFMTTTEVIDPVNFEPGKEIRLNEIAKRILPGLGIEIHDLNAVSLENRDLHIGAQDVHYTIEGYQVLGNFVVESVLGGN